MINKPKRKSIGQLKKELDKLFSLYIRKRDNYTCVLCGSRVNVQCGHLIKRGRGPTRWSETNCHCQCPACNIKHNYYSETYTNWWLKKYGQREYDKLCKLSEQQWKYDRFEIERLIEKYKPSAA